MAKLAVSEVTTYRWSFEEDVRNYVDAGIEAIGVWRSKLSDFGEERGADLIEHSGLSVSSLLWAGGFTGSDGRTHKESVADARDAIRLAARLNADCLLLYSGARAGHTHRHARRLFRTALGELVVAAAEFDVTLAIEPMHTACAGDWTFLTSLDETLSVLDDISDPRIQLAFDTYHFGQDASVVQRLTELAPRIATVHLGDAKGPPHREQNRCPLGVGCLPLPEIVARLQQAGFNGYFEVELMGEEIEVTDYRDLLNHSKQVFDSWTNLVNGR
jgi:sugar phosphate isomerase/epimerase